MSHCCCLVSKLASNVIVGLFVEGSFQKSSAVEVLERNMFTKLTPEKYALIIGETP